MPDPAKAVSRLLVAIKRSQEWAKYFLQRGILIEGHNTYFNDNEIAG